tara:strand:- start:13189 stop:13395 length:207 start_codon:yes stop_codon:yes gene_type:complete
MKLGIVRDPWREIRIPEPPEGAPREQIFEFCALAGLYVGNTMPISPFMKRCARAYVERWHDDVELPPL